MSAEMEAADAKLEADLQAIFGDLETRMLPAGKVAEIHSSGYAEDGITFCVMLDMEGGGTVMISLAPGSPITAAIVA